MEQLAALLQESLSVTPKTEAPLARPPKRVSIITWLQTAAPER